VTGSQQLMGRATGMHGALTVPHPAEQPALVVPGSIHLHNTACDGTPGTGLHMLSDVARPPAAIHVATVVGAVGPPASSCKVVVHDAGYGASQVPPMAPRNGSLMSTAQARTQMASPPSPNRATMPMPYAPPPMYVTAEQ